jgi:hypothetical protein
MNLIDVDDQHFTRPNASIPIGILVGTQPTNA